MNILVTGGNGFLGSSFVKRLVDAHYNVLVLSRSSAALDHIKGKIQFYKFTGRYADHAETIRQFSPNWVFHFAWDGGNNYAESNSPNQVLRNIPAGIELLTLITSLPSRPSFVGIGSFSEYGRLTSKARETQSDAPISFYGIAKSMFKTISQKMCADANISWSWVRPCYIYGPNDVQTRLIPSVIRSLQSNHPVVLDSCNVVIDYLHVNDFVDGLLRIIECNASGIFNVCSGQEYSLRHLLEWIQTTIHPITPIQFAQTTDRSLTSSYICGDNQRLLSLGWSPQISIYQGLETLIRSKRSISESREDPPL